VIKRRIGGPICPLLVRLASCSQQTGDDENAVLLRSDLGAVTQPVPRLNGAAGCRAMIEASAAILALISLAIFAAHALDAYRTS